MSPFRFSRPVLVAVLVISVLTIEVVAQPADIAAILNRYYARYNAGDYRGALAEAQQLEITVRDRYGQDDANYGLTLGLLSSAYERLGRQRETESLLKRVLAIYEKHTNERNIAATLGNLARLYNEQGRYREAEELLARTAEIYARIAGTSDWSYANSSLNLAITYKNQGRYAAAEKAAQRALSIFEQKSKGESELSLTLNLLAGIYAYQGRQMEAVELYKRNIALQEAELGAEHPYLADTLANLAIEYGNLGRFLDAESLLKRALSIQRKSLGPQHPQVAHTLVNLGNSYTAAKQYNQAEEHLKLALAIGKKTFSDNDPQLADILLNLGTVYVRQGKLGAAEEHSLRALEFYQKGIGINNPNAARGLYNLAIISRDLGKTGAMKDYARKATASVIAYAATDVYLGGDAEPIASTVEGKAHYFRTHVAALWAATQAGLDSNAALASEGWEIFQWAIQSSSAAALSQMGLRFASGDDALAALVRERQDLAARSRKLSSSLGSLLGKPQRDASVLDDLRRGIADINDALKDNEAKLERNFPNYSSLAKPMPVTLADTRSLLQEDEALVMFLPDNTNIYIFALTADGFEWKAAAVGRDALAEKVAAFRRGLDADMIRDQTYLDSVGKRREIFDLTRAHNLYDTLLGPVGDVLERKRHLIIVAPGVLTGLPFHLLVTAAPRTAQFPAGDRFTEADAFAYRDADWLIRRHAITVLPSVASLKGLRQFAKTSRASEPFIGFGNPLLSGPDGRDRRAWERQSCNLQSPPVEIASRQVSSAIPKFFRGGLANVDEVRAQYPLPETTDELCAVAQSTGGNERAVYLGDRAREATIKALSAEGTLARARVVHFATHGLLAGETEMLAASKSEPALILTPPQTATEEDDGLLTASEIAQLKLDADWVVLSACNTAAGESNNPGAEALSGLARAFFYAGARALLVSHWAVNSEATVRLITKAFAEIKSDPKIGRAEALRRSMLALGSQGGIYAHPAIWGPFVIVGEGATH
jgi:CHAT domain-containing protein/tetratricopeptide (TPR) repeat protein